MCGGTTTIIGGGITIIVVIATAIDRGMGVRAAPRVGSIVRPFLVLNALPAAG
jgi:hypothetical protein